MPRKSTGAVYLSRGRFYAKITVAKGKRETIALASSTAEEADQRAELLASLALKLRGVEHVTPEIVRGILERAATRDGKDLEAVLRAAEGLSSGQLVPKRGTEATASPTFREIAHRWTSGELAREYPDHVKAKRRTSAEESYLERHILPAVGDVRIAAFTLDHGLAVARALPSTLEGSTRRSIVQAMHRVLSLAVWPLRLIPANPLPPGFLPKVGPGKAKGWLYPAEDAALLASPAVPLCWRVLYGFLHREGPRLIEASRFTWPDFELERGSVNLDENKTDEPRAWALSPGVAAAIRAWRSIRERAEGALDPAGPVFIDEEGAPVDPEKHQARRFRTYLHAAGITRPALFETTSARRQIRAHDMRATFVTLSLANGKTETWVQDRTGHKSSIMINRYRRAARTAAELGLGELAPLDQAIPELAAEGDGPDGGSVRRSVRGEGEGADDLSTEAAIHGLDAREATSWPSTSTRQAASQRDAISVDGLRAEHVTAPLDSGADASEPPADASEPPEPPPQRGEPGGFYLALAEGEDAGADPSPRAPPGSPPAVALLYELAGTMLRAAAAGEIRTARATLAAIGSLLGGPPDDQRGAEGARAVVVDLGAARERRGGA